MKTKPDQPRQRKDDFMILLIDNYDSFTYNLYQYIGEMIPDIQVIRNDEITTEQIAALSPDAIVISPGPGYPKDAGITIDVIRRFAGQIPILGICLGHQAIAEAFGGYVGHAPKLMHGKASEVTIDTASPIFNGLPSKISAARYHSLIAREENLPNCLQVIARADQNEIMAVKHKEFPVYGLQFHPESVLTGQGKTMLYNFLKTNGLAVSNENAAPKPKADGSRLKPLLKAVIEGENLSEEQAQEAMECIMEGGATNAQIGAFLTALRIKGETVEEITGFARTMRHKAALVKNGGDALDIVGTGGDLAGTFNISTTAAFVAAGAGIKVAKHGNRSVSSRSGSADVLEELGIRIDLTPQQVETCLDKAGIGFMFAQVFHKSMKYVAPARREMGVRTVFNILGPLANPAGAPYMLLGVFDEALLDVLAQVLEKLGIENAMVVHGDDGLDEVTLCAKTQVCEVRNGRISRYEIDPENYGLSLTQSSELTGGLAKENAMITLDILKGKKGAQRDVVLLNAGAAIYAAGSAGNMEEGIKKAAESIDSGAALQSLNRLREVSRAQ